MLSVSNLSIRYSHSSSWALKSVNFTAKPGELIIIAGPSGCGKSTLAQAILGLIPKFVRAKVEGNIAIKGKSLEKIERKEFLSQVGFIPQYPSDFITTLLTEEEIAFPLENMAMEPEKIEVRVTEVMQKLGILHLQRRIIPELSSGELQRVELATSIGNNPPILVLDEPMARIDPQSEITIAKIMRSLADSGHLVLAFEHRLDYLLSFADRIILLDGGRIVKDGKPKEVISDLTNVDLPEVVDIFNKLFDDKILTVKEAKNKIIEIFATKKGLKQSLNIEKEVKESQEKKSYLKMQNIFFKYPSGKRLIIENLDYAIEKGKLVGLLGVNGSGKSTLLRLITGSLKPKLGQVILEDKNIKGIRSTTEKIIFIPENAKLFLVGPTPRDDLVKTSADLNLIEEKLRKYGFSHLLDRKLYHMSEGERRLMSIFTAFQFNKPLILLDEPTIGLDSNGRKLFFECLQEAKKRDQLVIVSTNDQRIFPYFDEIIVLNERTIQMRGTPREVLYKLEENTDMIPNQIVRMIQKAEKETKSSFPHFLTTEELEEFLLNGGI
ncbi:MAG: ABC transporter ATP-binding protein [Candidatus Heimdallarchaeaceae archaeon]